MVTGMLYVSGPCMETKHIATLYALTSILLMAGEIRIVLVEKIAMTPSDFLSKQAKVGPSKIRRAICFVRSVQTRQPHQATATCFNQAIIILRAAITKTLAKEHGHTGCGCRFQPAAAVAAAYKATLTVSYFHCFSSCKYCGFMCSSLERNKEGWKSRGKGQGMHCPS